MRRKKGTQQTSYTKLVCWTPSQGVWVQDLTILGQNLLFSQCLCPPRNEKGPANCQGSLMKCLVPLVALCQGNWDSLTEWTTCLEYRPFLHKNANISCTLYLQEKYWVLVSENHIKSLFHPILGLLNIFHKVEKSKKVLRHWQWGMQSLEKREYWFEFIIPEFSLEGNFLLGNIGNNLI